MQERYDLSSQKINAEPASDYEFHPSAHVAQRVAAPPPAKPATKASTSESHGTLETEPPAADVQHLRAVKWLEVPILVEDVVGRQ